MKLPGVSKSRLTILAIAVSALLFAFGLHNIVQSATSRSVALKSSSPETPTALSNPVLVKRYQQTIKSGSLASRLYFLASDFFEGRETTTRGQKLAAQYLASQYRLMGLAPKGTVKTVDPLSPDAYLQPFTVYRLTPKETQLEVMLNGSKVASSTFSAETHDDLSYFLRGNVVDASGGVVFAGYGITDNALGYNDYAALAAKGISIDGKWVMILSDEPVKDAQTSLLPTSGHQLSDWTTSLSKKIAVLAAGKPAGILEVKLASPLIQGTFAENAARVSLNARRVGALSLNQSPDFPPTYAISDKLADQILASSGHKIEDLRQQINQSLKPSVFEASGVTIKTTVQKSEPLQTENVVAFIEGSDPQLKNEVVVIGSHYDHLGLNPALKGDQIFNGAADNGSSVVTSLEMAQAFMTAQRDGYGPRRSLLFINFSGEEKGLLGSDYYAHNEPLFPLENIAAAVNMDGVGGIDLKHPTQSRNYIYVIGMDNSSQEMVETNKRIKEVTGINLDLTSGPNFQSDQKNFQMQLIPVIYYSTGLTEHYHTPGDEPKTIDYEHLARVAQLIFGTVWQVANQDARPPSVDRSKLTVAGYVCPPCAFECDDVVHEHAGSCPICGMNLVPKYSGAAMSRDITVVHSSELWVE
jgi:hypothetical protein